MDLSQYAELFLAESREHLSACNHLLLEWERDPTSAEPVGGIFRAVHTVKGMAATMGYARVADLAHRMENLLDRLRQGSAAPGGDLLQLLFRATDLLERSIDLAVAGRERGRGRRGAGRRAGRAAKRLGGAPGRRAPARAGRASRASKAAPPEPLIGRAGRGGGGRRDECRPAGLGHAARRSAAQGWASAAGAAARAGARDGGAGGAAGRGVRGGGLRRPVRLPARGGDRHGGDRAGARAGAGDVERVTVAEPEGVAGRRRRGDGGSQPAHPRGPAAARCADGPDRRAGDRARPPERAGRRRVATRRSTTWRSRYRACRAISRRRSSRRA